MTNEVSYPREALFEQGSPGTCHLHYFPRRHRREYRAPSSRLNLRFLDEYSGSRDFKNDSRNARCVRRKANNGLEKMTRELVMHDAYLDSEWMVMERIPLRLEGKADSSKQAARGSKGTCLYPLSFDDE